eukprot:41268_1
MAAPKRFLFCVWLLYFISVIADDCCRRQRIGLKMTGCSRLIINECFEWNMNNALLEYRNILMNENNGYDNHMTSKRSKTYRKHNNIQHVKANKYRSGIHDPLMGGSMIKPVNGGGLLMNAMSPQSVHLRAPILPMYPRYQVAYPIYHIKRNIHRMPFNGFGGVMMRGGMHMHGR